MPEAQYMSPMTLPFFGSTSVSFGINGQDRDGHRYRRSRGEEAPRMSREVALAGCLALRRYS